MQTFQLLFLGTCACDYSPKLQNEARDCFDRDARRASSLLLNGTFLIDCGPHCEHALEIAGVEADCISDIFFTHLHSDHFDPAHIASIAAKRRAEEPLRLWVREDAVLPEIPRTKIIRMRPMERYDTGKGITVTGLPANHDPKAFPQWLLFEKAERKFLYALDGGWYRTETYNFLENACLAGIVMDATVGDYEGDYRMAEHNSIPMIRLMLPSLRKMKILDNETKIFWSHLAPSLHKTHAETVPIAEAMGMTLAYDGFRAEC